MKKKDRQRLKEEELKKQNEIKEEKVEFNYQDQYIRDIIAINRGVGMELLRLNRPHLFQPQTQVQK